MITTNYYLIALITYLIALITSSVSCNLKISVEACRLFCRFFSHLSLPTHPQHARGHTHMHTHICAHTPHTHTYTSTTNFRVAQYLPSAISTLSLAENDVADLNEVRIHSVQLSGCGQAGGAQLVNTQLHLCRPTFWKLSVCPPSHIFCMPPCCPHLS